MEGKLQATGPPDARGGLSRRDSHFGRGAVVAARAPRARSGSDWPVRAARKSSAATPGRVGGQRVFAGGRATQASRRTALTLRATPRPDVRPTRSIGPVQAKRVPPGAPKSNIQIPMKAQ